MLHALDELVAAGIDQVAVVSEPEVAPEVERTSESGPPGRAGRLTCPWTRPAASSTP